MRSGADRALRRELLVLRASLERVELSEALGELRASLALGRVLRRGAPVLAAEGALALVARYLARWPKIAGFVRALLGRGPKDDVERAERARGGLARLVQIAAAVAAGWRLWRIARTLSGSLRKDARRRP